MTVQKCSQIKGLIQNKEITSQCLAGDHRGFTLSAHMSHLSLL